MKEVKLGLAYNVGLAISGIFKKKTDFRLKYINYLQSQRFDLICLAEKCEIDFANDYNAQLKDCLTKKNKIENKLPIATKEYVEDYLFKVSKMPEYKAALDEEKANILKPIKEKINEFDEKIAEIKLNQEVIKDLEHIKHVQDEFY